MMLGYGGGNRTVYISSSSSKTLSLNGMGRQCVSELGEGRRQKSASSQHQWQRAAEDRELESEDTSDTSAGIESSSLNWGADRHKLEMQSLTRKARSCSWLTCQELLSIPPNARILDQIRDPCAGPTVAPYLSISVSTRSTELWAPRRPTTGGANTRWIDRSVTLPAYDRRLSIGNTSIG